MSDPTVPVRATSRNMNLGAFRAFDPDEVARRQLAQVGLALDLAAPALAELDDAVAHLLDVGELRRTLAAILARMNRRRRAARRAR